MPRESYAQNRESYVQARESCTPARESYAGDRESGVRDGAARAPTRTARTARAAAAPERTTRGPERETREADGKTREAEGTTREAERKTRERDEFLTGGMVPLACRSCGTTVLAKKNSPQHTSIQWTTDAATSCPEFAEQVAQGTHPALLDTCERLRESIAEAAREGVFTHD